MYRKVSIHLNSASFVFEENTKEFKYIFYGVLTWAGKHHAKGNILGVLFSFPNYLYRKSNSNSCRWYHDLRKVGTKAFYFTLTLLCLVTEDSVIYQKLSDALRNHLMFGTNEKYPGVISCKAMNFRDGNGSSLHAVLLSSNSIDRLNISLLFSELFISIAHSHSEQFGRYDQNDGDFFQTGNKNATGSTLDHQ